MVVLSITIIFIGTSLPLSWRHDTETFDSETFVDSDEYALFVGFTVNSVLTSVFEVQEANHPVYVATVPMFQLPWNPFLIAVASVLNKRNFNC